MSRSKKALLSYETLARLGRETVADKFDEALALLVADCEARPLIKKTRTITLTVELKPKFDETGSGAVTTLVNTQIATKKPAAQIGLFEMKPKLGQLSFALDADEVEESSRK